jgi:hypothetical protein
MDGVPTGIGHEQYQNMLQRTKIVVIITTYDCNNTFAKGISLPSKLGNLYHVTHFFPTCFQKSRLPSILIRSRIRNGIVTHVHEESSNLCHSIVTWLCLYIKTALLFFPLWYICYWVKDRQNLIPLYFPVCYFWQVIINLAGRDSSVGIANDYGMESR